MFPKKYLTSGRGRGILAEDPIPGAKRPYFYPGRGFLLESIFIGRNFRWRKSRSNSDGKEEDLREKQADFPLAGDH